MAATLQSQQRPQMAFDVLDAVKYGYKEAIIIARLHWLAETDGPYFPLWRDPWWTHHFPFWTSACIKTTLDSLLGQGLLFRANDSLTLVAPATEVSHE